MLASIMINEDMKDPTKKVFRRIVGQTAETEKSRIINDETGFTSSSFHDVGQ